MSSFVLLTREERSQSEPPSNLVKRTVQMLILTMQAYGASIGSNSEPCDI